MLRIGSLIYHKMESSDRPPLHAVSSSPTTRYELHRSLVRSPAYLVSPLVARPRQSCGSNPGPKTRQENQTTVIFDLARFPMWYRLYYNGDSVIYRLTGPWRVVGKPMYPKKQYGEV